MNLVTLSVSETLPLLAALVPHPVRDEKEVTDVYTTLLAQDRLNCIVITESIPDLTSKADIPKVQSYLRTNYPHIH